jgi:hypothetical protein
MWIVLVLTMVVLSAGLCGCQGGGAARDNSSITSSTEEAKKSDQERPRGPAKLTDKEIENIMIESSSDQ